MTIRVQVPATAANLGPGFDTLGMALQFYNYFEATPSTEHANLTIQLSPSTCVDTEGLDCDPNNNLLAQAYTHYFTARKDPLIAADLTIEAHIPLCRGMGSSSSAIVGGLALANALHPTPLPREELLPMAIALEGHPDNVTPALLGNVHCCLDNGSSIQLTWPPEWGIILIIPPHPVTTEQARSVMPPHYTTSQIIPTMQGLAAWVHALQHQDAALFSYALHTDEIHQPVRSTLILEFAIATKALQSTEAMGCVISGSGSTLAVFTPTLPSQKELLSRLKENSDLGHCKIIPIKPDSTGTTIV